tara:strand:- start:816 stop:920 length:105 start_codon:yes stop_codon:yes gene_type:complete
MSQAEGFGARNNNEWVSQDKTHAGIQIWTLLWTL